MRLTTADWHRIWSLSNELLGADNVEHAFDILFDQARLLVPFDSAVAFPFEPQLNAIADSGHLSRGMDGLSGVAADYVTHYHRLDPLNILEEPQNLNRALRTADVINRVSYRNGEFYQDFSRHLGIESVLGVCASVKGKPLCGIALHRGCGAREFSAADRTRLSLVAPTFAHSLHALHLRQLAARWFDDEAGVAVWLVESGSGAGRCNAEAERFARLALAGCSGHSRSDGLPVAVRRVVDRLRSAAAASAGMLMRPLSESISCRSGNHWYAFTVTMLPVATVGGCHAPVVVTAARRRNDREIDDRLRGLGLTAREREITRLIVRGSSNKEVARCLSITEQTVKDHLRSIFTKADATSRTRLIARLVWED